MSDRAAKSSFFRQSGWMVICTVVSGLAFYGVHPFAKFIPESEYGVMGLFIAFSNCMGIPAIGLQMVFAQQTAAAISDSERRLLSSTARGVLIGIFALWLVALVTVVIFQQEILVRWKISNSAGLWVIVCVALVTMWLPIFSGILQGLQNFLWLGWSSILNSVGRVSAVAIIVLVFHGYAAGMSGGILFGSSVSVIVGAWFTRSVWLANGVSVDWRSWLRRVIPLTFGFGSFQFMMASDPLFVQAWFDKSETGFYMAAGTLGRALVTFTGPIVAVMFPKIVRSAAARESSGVMPLTLIITGCLVALGALGLSVVAPYVLTLVYKESYRAAVPLLPWFAAAMAPLAVANVLLSDLLARSKYKVVPWLVAVVAGYILTLFNRHGSFVAVIQNIGLFNLLFLSVVGFFARIERPSASRGQ